MDDITSQVIAAAIEVHRELGPGLLEGAYEECLARELALREVPFARQVPVPLAYKGGTVDVGFQLDMVVAEQVLLELKAVDALLPIHQAQVLTYMKLSGLRVGLLINFNVRVLRSGIKRLVLGFPEDPPARAQRAQR